MQNTQPITQLLTRLWQHISPRRRGQFGLLLIFMVLTSFSEILSIGAVLPFLAVLTAPARVFEHAAAQPIIQMFELTAPEQLLLPLTIAFGAAALIAGSMRLLLLWVNTRLSFAIGADLSMNIYRRTLCQPYLVHCARNSSEVISGISGKANGIIQSIILPTLMLISAGVILIAVLIAILAVEPTMALMTFSGFGLLYVFIMRLTRKRLLIDSQCMARESVEVIKSLQEGLGGIRDVLIDGSQATYCQIYRQADLRLRHAQGRSAFISNSPRYGVEALGMLCITVLAYTLSQQADGIIKVIPVLAAMALGAQRLLPALQQVYGSWVNIQSGQAALQDTLNLLDQPLPDYADQPPSKPLPFEQSISLNQLGFRYDPQAPYVLKQVNLTIAKGSRVGFIGATGSGKSTLLDVVMGLLEPTEGTLAVDDQAVTVVNHRAWQAHIAHVPQTVFLADSTIEENIAFGVSMDQIDHERVKRAAQQAQLADSIASWPKQYQTFVGERGIRLSGGQRQRIGIARALYKKVDVIVFDEATSALDSETEQAVMQAIEGLSKDLTLLIIAHRLSTLKNCTQIVELGEGQIKKISTYAQMIDKRTA
jgi:ABC-type multidrug transport system fused ATPase/permease subunit